MRALSRILIAAACSACILLAVAVPASSAPTRPFRGSVAWSVILCKTSDAGIPPHDSAYYRDMFFNLGTGGLADYYDTISLHGLNFGGSVVHGWYPLPYTLAQEQARNEESPRRTKPYQDCLDAARAFRADPYTPPSGQLVAVITYPSFDQWGSSGCCAFLPDDVNVGAMGHEAGHGLSLNHSFSDSTTFRDADWAQIAEYDDPWDMMSWANAHGVLTTRFDYGPPGLNAYHLDRMGWLPRSRIMVFGADGRRSADVTLAALNHPEVAGPLEIRVPFDPTDPFRYYTIEFRSKDGWNAGIPAATVMIHETRWHADASTYFSHLLRTTTGDRPPVQSVTANGVSISVLSTGTQTATMRISGDDRCLQGFVWREATPVDHVCVIGATRSQARADTAAGPSHRAGGGASGPDTCSPGYVWREATPADHVCVTPARRQETRNDNTIGYSRSLPQSTYGPNTCKPGFVWREADGSDWVCVSAAIRDQVRNDNAAPTAHRAGGGASGPDTCVSGYVWRDAFPGDHVCVVVSTRSQARDDNAHAGDRLMHY
jgi:hypothetical protein